MKPVYQEENFFYTINHAQILFKIISEFILLYIWLAMFFYTLF